MASMGLTFVERRYDVSEPECDFQQDDEGGGQGLVEYALILALVAVVIIIIMAIFGTGVGNMFSNVISNF